MSEINNKGPEIHVPPEKGDADKKIDPSFAKDLDNQYDNVLGGQEEHNQNEKSASFGKKALLFTGVAFSLFSKPNYKESTFPTEEKNSVVMTANETKKEDSQFEIDLGKFSDLIDIGADLTEEIVEDLDKRKKEKEKIFGKDSES